MSEANSVNVVITLRVCVCVCGSLTFYSDFVQLCSELCDTVKNTNIHFCFEIEIRWQ